MLREKIVANENNNIVMIPEVWYGMEVEVIIFPTKLNEKPNDRRVGWAEAARQMHEAGDDKMIYQNDLKEDNLEWWTW